MYVFLGFISAKIIYTFGNFLPEFYSFHLRFVSFDSAFSPFEVNFGCFFYLVVFLLHKLLFSRDYFRLTQCNYG